jgi:hypothetical protein
MGTACMMGYVSVVPSAVVSANPAVVASAMVAATVSSAMASLGFGQTGRKSQDCQDQQCPPDRPQ